MSAYATYEDPRWDDPEVNKLPDDLLNRLSITINLTELDEQIRQKMENDPHHQAALRMMENISRRIDQIILDGLKAGRKK